MKKLRRKRRLRGEPMRSPSALKTKKGGLMPRRRRMR